MRSTLPARPLRSHRAAMLLSLRIRRGAWRVASPAQRRWACAQLDGLLRDLAAGYHPRAAIRRARRP